MTRNKLWGFLFLFIVAVVRARADAALLLEEPYGGFGEVNPTGHAAIYLPRVCAAQPTVLRKCSPGELGAVISRYYKLAGHDWIAIPLVAYLYSVENPEQVPGCANVEAVSEISDLIAAQRAYEMNAKVITAADQMLSTTSNLMR